MPELSSIVRGDPSDEDPTNLVSIADLTLGEQESLFLERTTPDIFSFFVLAVQFEVPHYDLPLGQFVSRKGSAIPRSVVLGHGISSNVSVLQVEDDVSPNCPAGTLVACKRYHQAPANTAGADRDGTERIHAWLLQELRVFCHPKLRAHENICKLLFVGWDGGSVVPALGIELATYNTLEDSMQHLRSYGSVERKTNLTLDIARGLHVLHSLGLAHGDIKPGNIILCKHASRSVVAKISDFSGVAPTSTYASSRFTTGTIAWQPPEAFLGGKDIDWQLVDTYSFGMVTATIWCPYGWIPPGGSFLGTRIRYRMSNDDAAKVILQHKLYPDNHQDSPLMLAIRSVTSLSQDPLQLPLASLFTACLPCQPSLRVPILKLMLVLTEQEQNLSSESTNLDTNISYDVSYWEHQPIPGLLVIHPSYMRRSRPFKEKMLRTLLTVANDLRGKINPIVSRDIVENFTGTEEALYDYIRAEEGRSRLQLWAQPEVQILAPVALNLALSYFLGLGTIVREHAAIDWLAIAAQCQEGNAQYWFCPLEESTGTRVRASVPRRLWATYAVLAGFCSSLSALQTPDPKLADVAKSMAQKMSWGRSEPQIVRIKPYLERIMTPILADHAFVDLEVQARVGSERVGERALHVASAVGDLDLVKYLVLEARADINITNSRNETPIFYATRANNPLIATFIFDHGAQVDHVSTEGLSIAHCLTMMDDERAAELLPRYLERGASLAKVALDAVQDRSDKFSLAVGLPLMWAVFKNRPLLFEAIVKSHTQSQLQISPADYCALLNTLCALNHVRMLETAVYFYPSLVNESLGVADTQNTTQLQLRFLMTGNEKLQMDLVVGDPFQGIMPANYTRLLLKAMDANQRLVLDRRYLHRGNFKRVKERIYKFLLQQGAIPTQRCEEDEPESTPLSYAVYTGDTVAFRIFVEHLKTLGVEVLPVLSNPENFGGYSALQRAIYSDARDIFLFLLQDYAELIDLKGEAGRGPLQSAATQEWPRYCEELLARGASVYDRSDDRSTPFTWALMRNPNLDGAKKVTEMMAVGADLERLLGPDQESGFKAFAKMIHGVTVYRMDYGLDRLEYLVQRYGRPSFIANSKTGASLISHVLMAKPSLSDASAIAVQAAMLRYLLELFPEKVNFMDTETTGTPLHVASALGNLTCVEILLDSGADVDIETRRDGREHGITALGLVVQRMHDPPPRAVREGGSREIATFRKNIELIVAALARKGAESAGQAASTALMLRVLNALDKGESHIHVQVLSSPDTSTSAILPENEWSKRLPWEGEGHAPYEQQDGSQDMVEYVCDDGLLHVMPERSYSDLELLLGAINPRMRSKGYVEMRDPAPDKYIDSVERSIEALKTVWINGGIIPAGWEIREDLQSGRIYFIDHNRRKTSWDPPITVQADADTA
ncbi:serine threonine kinase [Fusarium beomiforme]|uniref:Serine threonine kinase n=1 Tax=Fusarium beomiforme TaxID=44412 RepID=A0A9P5AMK9_9HYPO|nr:serine threonine kinase [Fusarium beomiforme]